MKINLKGEGIEYSIEMDAQEMKAGMENFRDLITLLLDKKYEILAFAREIKELNKKQAEATSADIPSSLFEDKKVGA